MVFGHHADISPDGSRIVYATCEYTHSSGTSGRYEIAMVNPDGTGRQQLTSSKSFENYPVWSPNGDRIAFIAHYPDNIPNDYGNGHYEPSETRIFTMAADGTDVKVVPNTKGVGLYPPVWSPDGERLAFIVHEEKLGYPYYTRILYTVRIDGSELHSIGEASTLPTWSPDGERLAFGLKDENEDSVYTVRADGSDARLVLDLRVIETPWLATDRPIASPPWYRDYIVYRHVSWSPDGSELLIASSWLSTVRPDGSGLRGLGQMGLGPIIDATWSSDGSMIAVRQLASRDDDSDSSYVISVVTRDGGDVTIVAEGNLDFGASIEASIRTYTPRLPHTACSDGVVVPDPEANPGLVKDCETLTRAIGRLVEQPAWEALAWNADTPIAEWSGVTVGGDPPRVRELTLEDSGLTGIPAELAALTKLEVLDLSFNETGGLFPPELGKLSMLKVLDLGVNWLTGPIPPELGRLTMLEELDLYANNLTGPIPPELGELSLLKSLYLFANLLTGPIPPELGKLTMLEYLLLGENELSGCIPVEFPDLWVRRSGLAPCEQ